MKKDKLKIEKKILRLSFSWKPFIYYSGRSYGVDHAFAFAAYGLFV